MGTVVCTPAITSSVFFLLFSVVFFAHCAADQNQERCSRSCVAEGCDSVGIQYGKYCGVGWTGCLGEEPCDELDVCCRIHDNCVERNGMMSVKCHQKFKRCIKKVKKSGKIGFSKKCPYEIVIPTMIQGMDMAILFSQLGGDSRSHTEL
ncbi:Phospholipase A(2) [Zostera marina]|uniref:phospholipase A2 n=1 Tax=Zostera marina TaxID=29655 RepID=A0A0K9NWU2_ZOSMR|nr:Phospholipase A(2) [Zostera marina]